MLCEQSKTNSIRVKGFFGPGCWEVTEPNGRRKSALVNKQMIFFKITGFNGFRVKGKKN